MALAPDWESLPIDILDSILDKLVSIKDCIRFSAVSRRWRSAAVENLRQVRKSSTTNRHDRLHQQQLPLMIFPVNCRNRSNRGRLYSVIQKRFFDFKSPVRHGRRFCGSSHGWLIMVSDTFEVALFNPFSGKTINIPPIRRLAAIMKQILESMMLEDEADDLAELDEYEYEDEDDEYEFEDEDDGYEFEDEDEEYEFEERKKSKKEREEIVEAEFVVGRSEYIVIKGVLSANPSLNPKDYVLIIIYGLYQSLAFIKSGDKDWTYLDHLTNCAIHNSSSPLCHIKDVIFHKQRFYALCCMGQLVSVETDGCAGAGLNMTSPDRLGPLFGKEYLVESLEGGDILRVVRIYGYNNNVTEGFKVYKLQAGCHMLGTWVEVSNFGDYALFLGDNHSVSVAASDYPGCQPDSIYFCWDHVTCSHLRLKGPYDVGIFNLKYGMVVQTHTLNCSNGLSMPPPIWILPTFM